MFFGCFIPSPFPGNKALIIFNISERNKSDLTHLESDDINVYE